MPAGLFLTGQIIRFTDNQDDVVGGAVPSGTVVYPHVWGRIEAEQPTLALLEQGLETPTIMTALIAPGTISVHHNDQLEITGPNISPYKNEKFRVIGVQSSSMNDPRRFVVLTIRRIEESHANVLQ